MQTKSINVMSVLAFRIELTFASMDPLNQLWSTFLLPHTIHMPQHLIVEQTKTSTNTHAYTHTYIQSSNHHTIFNWLIITQQNTIKHHTIFNWLTIKHVMWCSQPSLHHLVNHFTSNILLCCVSMINGDHCIKSRHLCAIKYVYPKNYYPRNRFSHHQTVVCIYMIKLCIHVTTHIKNKNYLSKPQANSHSAV